jgi:Trehalose receptor
VVFYCLSIFSGLFFFRLAQQWPDVLLEFSKVENIFEDEIYAQSSGWTLKKRIRVTSTIMLLLALSEHLMSWSTFLFDRFLQIELCDYEIGSYFYYLATTHLSHIYNRLPTTWVTVFWAEYMNVSFTFAWSFIDIFIIIVSFAIAIKFEKINTRLEYFRGRVSYH